MIALRMRRPARVALVAALVLQPALARVARADPPRTEAPAAGDEARAQAQARWKRGVELYAEGDYAGAQAEFRRAYALSPHYRVLYNLGQVACQLHDYIGGAGYLAQFLREGGDEIPTERRREVEQELRRLDQRIGRLELNVDTTGADIVIDGVPRGKSPLGAPVPVNVGAHAVEVKKPGRQPQQRRFEVSGGEVVRASFALASAPSLPSAAPAAAHGNLGLTATRMPSAPRHESLAWPWWTATAVFAAGAATTGYLAYDASTKLRDQRATFPITHDELAASEHRTRTLSVITDALLITTVVLTSISVYRSFEGGEDPAGPPRAARGPSAAVGPGSAGFAARF
jgi:hypothetical protein